MSELENSPDVNQRVDGQSGPDDQTAVLDRLLGQVTEAAQRLVAVNVAWEARANYAARLEREAYAEHEHSVQAEASYEADIEL